MDEFHYRDGALYGEDVNLGELAERVGTPAYVYSRKTLEDHYDRLRAAFAELDPLICYSIKSCGNVHLLKLLAERGAGMDAVSGGEIHRAQEAGVPMEKVVYAGVGKTAPEIRQAIEAGIGYFNIESEQEFETIAAIARHMGRTAHACLRINPDVADPKTHAKTTTGKKETKFGVDIERGRRFFERYGGDHHLHLCGLHLHIGSPISSPDPYVNAVEKALALIEELRDEGYAIDTIDIGGGFATDYETGQAPSFEDYAGAIVPLLRGRGLKVILEPGRTIAGNAGVLLSRVQYVKHSGSKTFVVVDSGMHTLLRPSYYDAFHFIWPAQVSPEHVPERRAADPGVEGLEPCEVVGPICETGDVLAADRKLPPVDRGDLLCVFTTGAYGMVMSSTYNAMPRPAEVLIEGDKARLIRRRETYDDLIEPEREAEAV